MGFCAMAVSCSDAALDVSLLMKGGGGAMVPPPSAPSACGAVPRMLLNHGGALVSIRAQRNPRKCSTRALSVCYTPHSTAEDISVQRHTSGDSAQCQEHGRGQKHKGPRLSLLLACTLRPVFFF